MRTTLDISNTLFREAKRYAAEQGASLRELVESGLRLLLEQRGKSGKPFRLRRHTFRGKGLAEGLVEGDWSVIRQRVYEGRGG